MNSIARETRKESYERIKPERQTRKAIILNRLGAGEKTANEIAHELWQDGILPYPDRNFVQPRLNELEKAGTVEITKKRTCEYTGRTVAVYTRRIV